MQTQLSTQLPLPNCPQPVSTLRRLKVMYDDFPCNPRREFDNLGTMVCFHKRYDLGDEDHGYRFDDYNGWDELEADILRREKAWVVLPLYLYDHSGITMSTGPFGCPWDSGMVGLIFMSEAAVRENWPEWKLPSKKRREQLSRILTSEVEEYDYYLTGQCYMFYVEEAEVPPDFDTEEDDTDGLTWQTTDSCSGFLGRKWAVEATAEHTGFTSEKVEEAFDAIR